MNKLMWISFSLFTLAGAGTLSWRFDARQRGEFLPGETSHGHYQIELACEACHTPFGGVQQDACLECHAEELETADDSHPAKKFTDPRNADLLSRIDALKCVTCHEEHQPERTASMTVTQPLDYCVHCHAEIGEDRPSHRELPFDGCRAAGCHNFHDNRALTLEHLQAHLGEPKVLAKATLPAPAAAPANRVVPPLAAGDADAPAQVREGAARALGEWAASAHARAAVNCSDCHGAPEAWVQRPGHAACGRCHEGELEGFLAGHHGMRLAQELAPMRPGQARLPMREAAAERELGCGSCHGAHAYDRTHAAVDACLECHADRHSLAYEDSPHARLWRAEQRGELPAGTGVSCAGCHLPRSDAGRPQHNQNDNLRPATKQLRGVCDRCHGLGFAIDALADRSLIERGFVGQPARHVPSLDWARDKLSPESARSSARPSPTGAAVGNDI